MCTCVMQLVIVSTASVQSATTDMGSAMGRSSVQMLPSMILAARRASVSILFYCCYSRHSSI